jgi:ribose 5-phosphate isomerase RpiB
MSWGGGSRVLDLGTAMADAVASGRAEKGLVCGTSIGISMAANRNP